MEEREVLVGMSRGVDFDHDDVVAARTQFVFPAVANHVPVPKLEKISEIRVSHNHDCHLPCLLDDP